MDHKHNTKEGRYINDKQITEGGGLKPTELSKQQLQPQKKDVRKILSIFWLNDKFLFQHQKLHTGQKTLIWKKRKQYDLDVHWDLQ